MSHSCSQTNQNSALDHTQINHTPLIVLNAYVAHDHEYDHHDSLHYTKAAQLYS
jgi:hypothetical protein